MIGVNFRKFAKTQADGVRKRVPHGEGIIAVAANH
jgi:hypothetical protein